MSAGGNLARSTRLSTCRTLCPRLTWARPPTMSPLRPARVSNSDRNPLDLARLVIGGLLLFGTVVALLLWATGMVPRALLLVGAFWALYGAFTAVLDGILDPLIDFSVNLLQNVGLMRAGGGYSGIESLEARGFYDEAASEYLTQAHGGAGDAEAMVRRAALLAGSLKSPEAAAAELHNFRDTRRLRPADDVRVGLALADLYEHRLASPGKAMGELRRLIDRYPGARDTRRIGSTLAALRQERFGGEAKD